MYSKHIKISPENIKGDLIKVFYPSGDTHSSGYTYFYSPMSDVLSGDSGNSILTGLTIPILLTQQSNDIGYYNITDGNIEQYDYLTNFIFSSTTEEPNKYFIYNTSKQNEVNYLKEATYTIDWGDGITPIQNISDFYPNSIEHNYLNNGEYTIKLYQDTPWGINLIEKTIKVPYSIVDNPNPKGNVTFTPKSGSWSGTSISLNYIFTGDSAFDVSNHISSNYTTIPTIISGETSSRLNELQVYGAEKYKLHVEVQIDDTTYGTLNTINSEFTGYTIDGIQYFDFNNGQTIYVLNISGITLNNFSGGILIKNETFMNMSMETEVQSDVFIERGKNSANERVLRLGEIGNIGQLTKYGYGFFNFK